MLRPIVGHTLLTREKQGLRDDTSSSCAETDPTGLGREGDLGDHPVEHPQGDSLELGFRIRGLRLRLGLGLRV